MRLHGKVGYVTGGGRGIGRGIALALAHEGAHVLIADIDAAAARSVAAEVSALGVESHSMQMDVTRCDDAQRLRGTIEERFGKLDIAVNSAGVIGVQRVEDMTEPEWDRIMDVNAKGPFLCCRAVIPLLRRVRGGTIVNIASVSGKDGYPGLAHYSASKYAVIGFTNSLAKELAREEITVNAICPGVVRTAMWDLLVEEWRNGHETPEESWQRQVLAFVPQGRAQTVEDIGDLVVYLALARSLTGQAINVDGGLTSH
ncbi:MAG TPA: SDR family NAD(P)-dependent oxidoreductase [Steroidobacteraceae bacterium]|jgi:meso-butanediol dehydrogenase/(S,S)-butanediol dehydrogenase/diacetyl reductase|nr:SDR family NAD(P)-dependent oxidoreductase [Steroidobacteraceae bacterium]